MTDTMSAFKLIKTCTPKLGQTEIVQSSLSSRKGMSCPGACGVREYGRYSGLSRNPCVFGTLLLLLSCGGLSPTLEKMIAATGDC